MTGKISGGKGVDYSNSRQAPVFFAESVVSLACDVGMGSLWYFGAGCVAMKVNNGEQERQVYSSASIAGSDRERCRTVHASSISFLAPSTDAFPRPLPAQRRFGIPSAVDVSKITSRAKALATSTLATAPRS